MADAVEIGTLRWPVYIYRRDQEAQENGTGIDETANLLAGPVYARIEFLRPVTFYAANGQNIQVDSPITHMIWLRWFDYPQFTWVIKRTTILPGSAIANRNPLRIETYRVRRVTEMGGRKRMLQIECELERTDE